MSGTGYYGSNDPTNSVKALKEGGRREGQRRINTRGTLFARNVRTVSWSLPPLNLFFTFSCSSVLQQTEMQENVQEDHKIFLHFAWSIAKAKCIVATAICVSASRHIPTILHGPDVTWANGGVPSSCALGGFAIGARVSLPWQHTRM